MQVEFWQVVEVLLVVAAFLEPDSLQPVVVAQPLVAANQELFLLEVVDPALVTCWSLGVVER